jgi:hypothetical protein
MLLNMIDGRLRVLMCMGQQFFHHEVVINVSCCFLAAPDRKRGSQRNGESEGTEY